METKKKVIISLIVIILLGVVGIFIYKKNKGTVSDISNMPPFGNDVSSTVVVDKAKQQEFEQAIQKIASKDQDLDGISDTDEAKYKTDPTSADTDGDGLIDWQEISIYKTDPLKADTDGDTFADGYEVRHGFSPTGKGKL